MKRAYCILSAAVISWALLVTNGVFAADTPLGLPPLIVPLDNQITVAKVELGEKLFEDTRFSTTGEVSCATCHDSNSGFTDSPKVVSEGIHQLTGTRNAPTVINAAYMKHQFWDGREPDLESQSAQPFLNPVEMGLTSHEPILDVIRDDRTYRRMVRRAFSIDPDDVTMDHVQKAIASFERTIISGNSPFDRYRYGGDDTAMSEAAIRGLVVFEDDGRCVSCHTISQSFALFTDGKFHNLNVSFDSISEGVENLVQAYSERRAAGTDVDVDVLTEADVSELGRFAVTGEWTEIGAFKTSTLRNIEVTQPYMHDGSQATLEDVVDFYNNGGAVNEGDQINDFLSSGIRPLDLTDQQKLDLVEFMKALTSPEYASSDIAQ